MTRVVRPLSSKRVQIPPRGSGPQPLRGKTGESPERSVQPRPAWGVHGLATGVTDPWTRIGDPRQIRGPRIAQP
jgi:hypothetical protein